MSHHLLPTRYLDEIDEIEFILNEVVKKIRNLESLFPELADEYKPIYNRVRQRYVQIGERRFEKKARDQDSRELKDILKELQELNRNIGIDLTFLDRLKRTCDLYYMAAEEAVIRIEASQMLLPEEDVFKEFFRIRPSSREFCLLAWKYVEDGNKKIQIIQRDIKECCDKGRDKCKEAMTWIDDAERDWSTDAFRIARLEIEKYRTAFDNDMHGKLDADFRLSLLQNPQSIFKAIRDMSRAIGSNGERLGKYHERLTRLENGCKILHRWLNALYDKDILHMIRSEYIRRMTLDSDEKQMFLDIIRPTFINPYIEMLNILTAEKNMNLRWNLESVVAKTVEKSLSKQGIIIVVT